MLRWLRYLVEVLPILPVYGLLRLLPLDAASGIGGFLGRHIGRWLPVHKDAERSLRAILPGKTDQDYRRILDGMWDNLGRTVAEFPHLNGAAMGRRFTLLHPETFEGQQPPVMFVTGHLGNWEILPRVALSIDVPIHVLYRPTNNPLLDLLIHWVRSGQAGGLQKKGASGARELHRALRQKKSLGLLIDQKENNGLPLDFMGRMAMTGTLPARLAFDHGLPVYPARVTRLRGAHFSVEFGPRLLPNRLEKREEAVIGLSREMNAVLARWVAERPEQWFWVHHRWPEDESKGRPWRQ